MFAFNISNIFLVCLPDNTGHPLSTSTPIQSVPTSVRFANVSLEAIFINASRCYQVFYQHFD